MHIDELGQAGHRPRWRRRLADAWDSDLAYSFRRTPIAVASAAVLS